MKALWYSRHIMKLSLHKTVIYEMRKYIKNTAAWTDTEEITDNRKSVKYACCKRRNKN